MSSTVKFTNEGPNKVKVTFPNPNSAKILNPGDTIEHTVDASLQVAVQLKELTE